jgi:hypothetical protein
LCSTIVVKGACTNYRYIFRAHKAIKKLLADSTDVSKEYATRVMRLKLDMLGDCFDKIRKRLEANICSCAKDETYNDCIAILDGCAMYIRRTHFVQLEDEQA